MFWFRPDGRRMTRRDWDSTGGGAARRVPQRRRDPRPRRRAASRSRDDSFLVIFNALHEDTRSCCRPALRAPLADRGVDRRAGRVASRSWPHARRSPSRRGRSWCCAGSAERDRSRRDLSPAARSRLRLRGRARPRAVSPGARHQPPVPVADHAGPRRVHARLRRRRPDPRVRRARGRVRVPARWRSRGSA